MRRYLFFFLLLLGCSSEKEISTEDRLMGDLSGYKSYRMNDYLESEEIKDEQVWELEWFHTLSREDQYFLLDSMTGFERLRPYLMEFDDVYFKKEIKPEIP